VIQDIKKRASFLRELERIIGSETFNGKTQNYGPNGTFLGEGRDYRYPMSFTDETGEKIKPKPPYNDLPIDVQMTGRYVMGANELHIMRAREKAVQYFEKNHGLKI
jgi:hypothetical protein